MQGCRVRTVVESVVQAVTVSCQTGRGRDAGQPAPRVQDLQDCVTDEMAVHLVDLLEVIDVNENQGSGNLRLRCQANSVTS